MTISEDVETENWKLIAELELAKYEVSRGRLLEEHSAAFRWLMASLLALNGAGLLALKDAGLLGDWRAILSGVNFYIGCGCALMIAVFGQRSSQAGLNYLGDIIAFWTAVRVTGHYMQNEHQTISAQIQVALNASKRAPRAGWASFAFFSLGMIFLALSSFSTGFQKSDQSVIPHSSGRIGAGMIASYE